MCVRVRAVCGCCAWLGMCGCVLVWWWYGGMRARVCLWLYGGVLVCLCSCMAVMWLYGDAVLV